MTAVYIILGVLVGGSLLVLLLALCTVSADAGRASARVSADIDRQRRAVLHAVDDGDES